MINTRRRFALTLILLIAAIPIVLSRSALSDQADPATARLAIPATLIAVQPSPTAALTWQDPLHPWAPTAAKADSSLRVFEIADVWQDDGLTLSLVKTEFFPDSVLAFFALTNLGPVDRKIRYGVSNFTAVDNLGRPVPAGGVSWQPDAVFQADCLSRTLVLKPGVREPLLFLCHYGNYEGLMLKLDRSEAALTHVTITVSGIDTMGPSRWRVPVGGKY